MKRALVAYFTGSGNARRAAGIVATELEAAGWTAETVDIAAGAGIPAVDAVARLGASDLLAMAFPALGFSPPHTVVRWISRLPRSNGVRVAVLCTVGSSMVGTGISPGWGGGAVFKALRGLMRRGYDPAGSAEASYPQSWTQAANPPGGGDAAAMVASGDAEAQAFGKALASGRAVFLERGLASRVLVAPVSALFLAVARRVLGLVFVSDGSCDGCALCARSCPAGAITMRNGRPAWTLRCVACNRCINACPRKAIQTSVARLLVMAGLNVAAFVACWPVGRAVAGALGARGAGAGFLSAAASLASFGAFTALQVGPLDALLRRLERTRVFGGILGMSFTRGYRRYLAPGFRPGSEPYRD